MLPTWPELIADLIDRDGKRSVFARRVQVPSERIRLWLRGTPPSLDHVRKVARGTHYSLPYLMRVAFGMSLEEIAAGAGPELLAADSELVHGDRAHIVDQFGILREKAEQAQLLSEIEQILTERRGEIDAELLGELIRRLQARRSPE